MVPGALAHAWPALAFLLLVTVASEQLERLGVFHAVALRVAHAARGRAWALLALICALAVVVTSVLGLDATAVLLTPVAIGVARSVGLPPAPFALACVWLANTASLVSPVGNLTTLLALAGPGAPEGIGAHVARTWAPQLVLLAVTVLVLCLPRVGLLRHRFNDPGPRAPVRPAVWWALAGVAACAVAVLAGVPAWLAAAGLVVALVAVRAVVDRGPVDAAGLVRSAPWLMAVAVAGLVVVTALVASAWSPQLAALVGGGGGGGHDGPLALVRIAAVGAGLANLVDNLPAFLVLVDAVRDSAGAADQGPGVAALLVGVDAGPLVTPWASLATLLWLRVCRRSGVRVPAREVFGGGAVIAVLSVLLAAPLCGW